MALESETDTGVEDPVSSPGSYITLSKPPEICRSIIISTS